MTLSAIILAAGASARFEGGHKLLAEIDGVPIIRRVANTIGKTDLRDLIVVTGSNDQDIRAALGEGRWRIIFNPRAPDGLSSSIRAGLETVDETDDGALIALGDLPGVDRGLIGALTTAFDATGRNRIVFPRAKDGRKGHPVIWPRSTFASLKALTGDTGGRGVFDRHRDLWHPVEIDHAGAFVDIDTRDDLETFIASQRKNS